MTSLLLVGVTSVLLVASVAPDASVTSLSVSPETVVLVSSVKSKPVPSVEVSVVSEVGLVSPGSVDSSV